MNRQVSHSAKPMGGWIRPVSTGCCSSNNSATATCIPSPPSSELCALMGFAYTLGSIVRNNDPSIVNNNDVRREAKLLMSLSCSSPIHDMDDVERRTASGNNNNKEMTQSVSSSSATSGRITPAHSITSSGSSSISTSVGSSRRDSFCFTCPSLSLDDTRNNSNTNTPGSMLSRTLKVDDKDALRLSSEAMARNVIESFQKAMEWRIQSWVDSLSRVLVIKEREFNNNSVTTTTGHDGNQQHELMYSNEALLVAALREIEGKVQVREATTAFKVMNKVSSVDEMGTPLKKQRLVEQEEEEDCRSVLEEGEYFYDVIHILEMQCSLNISSPAGNVQIDLNVPGKIQGSFLSSEEDYNNIDKLTDVTIDLNTEMLASMIEKSSRVAVRASAEALLKGEHVTVDRIEQAQTTNTKTSTDTTTKKLVQQQRAFSPNHIVDASSSTPQQTRTPKRKASADEANYVTGLMVVTPASRESASSSTSSYCESSDSDGDHIKPVRLHIPDNFPSFEGEILHLQASHASYYQTQQQQTTPLRNLDFSARLPSKKRTTITPLKTPEPRQFIKRETGPSLPVLVEVACAAIHSKKKN
jgi:hypothetical protein